MSNQTQDIPGQIADPTQVHQRDPDPERRQDPFVNPEAAPANADKEMTESVPVDQFAQIPDPPQRTIHVVGGKSGDDEPMSESEVPNRIVDMSLDERKALVAKYDHAAVMAVGVYVDAEDTINNNLLGKIVAIDHKLRSATINFDGWSQKWNSTQRFSKIAPFRTLASGYSGQKKIAIRTGYQFSLTELERHHQKVTQLMSMDFEGLTAFDTLQYLSGELFIFVDCVLVDDTYTENSPFDKIEAFFKTIMRLVVAWMIKVTKLTKTLEELEAVPNLFLVDPRAAIVQAGPEMMETLAKLLGNCLRGLHWFRFYDENQVEPSQITKEVKNTHLAVTSNSYGVVVQDQTDVDFEIARLTDQAKYSEQLTHYFTNRRDVQFGSILNWTQYFADIGGFDAFFKLFELGVGDEKAVKCPFNLVKFMLKPFKSLNQTLTPEFANILAQKLSQALIYRFENLSELDVKKCDLDLVEKVMEQLNLFLGVAMDKTERCKIIETTELLLGLRLLKSSNFEKRIRGLGYIRTMIDRVQKTEKLKSFKNRTNSQWQMNNELEGVQIAVTGFLNADYMSKWLIKNKVLDIIFGAGNHIEIVKRSQTIVNFLARYASPFFDDSVIELVWRCQEGKHEEMVRTVYEVIENTASLLSFEKLSKFFAKIRQETRIDEKYLKFLGQFTITAMNRQYVQMDGEWHRHVEEISENEEQIPENFDAHLNQQEAVFINSVEVKPNEQPQVIFTGEQFGMTLFWQLCLDNSQVPAEMREVALNQLLEMFIQGFRKLNRLNFLTMALSQLFQQKSVYQSIKLIKGVIKSFNYDQNHRMTNDDDEPQLIYVLHNRIQYLDKVVDILKQYLETVKQKLKESPGDMNTKFIGHQTHERTVKTFLNQIKFLLQDQQTCIGETNLSQLWQVFVESPNFTREQDMFLHWINRSKADYAGTNKPYYEILTPQEKKFLFVQILCNSAIKPDASLGLIKCFNTYFIQINKALGHIKQTTKRLRILNLDRLEGYDSLWQICVESQNAKIREICQELLVDIQLKQEEPNQQLQSQMVDKCMQSLEKEGTIQLLSTYFDRYEGIKEVQFDTDLQRKYPGLRPMKIKVYSLFGEKPVAKQVDLTHYQSLGYLREVISKEFGLQQNEFTMTLGGQHQERKTDPELDDDKYMRDFPGMFANVTIRQNPAYNPSSHPKFLISENQEYFEKIFGMLRTAPVDKLDNLYSLFIKLPTNQALREKYITLAQVKQATSEEERSAAWNDLLHPSFILKLLYCVKIINGLISSTEGGAEWTETFIQLGGFDQLVKCQIHLNITEIDSKIKLKVIKELIGLQQTLLKTRQDLLRNVPFGDLTDKLLQQVEMIIDFSISQEQARGHSYEDLLKRIEEAKAQKQSAKLHTLQNGKNKKKDDEDDSNTEDHKRKQSLIDQFFDQAVLCRNIFNIIKSLCSQQPQIGMQVLAQRSLEGILCKGMLSSENMYLRSTIDSSFFELMFPTQAYTNHALHTNAEHQFRIVNEEVKLLKTALTCDFRCIEFFKHFSKVIATAQPEVISKLEPQALQMIALLSDCILNREIKEHNSQETDHLLQGLMILLAAFLQKYPQQKLQVGDQLLKHLVYDCMFEIPHGSKDQSRTIAPKCKSSLTRSHAFNLMNVLGRDCLQNLKVTINFLTQFNKDVAWRTSKESDWKITLYNDEKSLTGYVGIKNLACICYMNSINQQLFMIPSFRNDILSIQDPNHDNAPDEDNMFKQWQQLFGGLLMSQKMYINPKAFCHSFKDFDGNPTNVVEQMDVDEYLGCLLDRLENAIKKTPQANTIHHHFGGWMANEIICKTCPHKYDRRENFLTVSISVKNKKSIKEGLDSFVEGDMLDENNQYFCEKCDKKVDALKRQCIKRLPRYLITTLKRFEFDFDTMQRSKVDDYCEFPEHLDMSNYTQEWLHKKEKGGEFIMDYPSDYYNYELVGIVVHSGTATSGHYYSYIKEQEANTDTWIEFNDAFVKEFDKTQIPNECFGGEVQAGWQSRYQKSHSAYVVVYRRKMEADPQFKDEEMQEPARGPEECLGQKKFSPRPDSAIAQRIAKQNHKYWQNRFLFSNEYTDFVYQMVVNWNTNFSLISSEQIPQPSDTKLPLAKLYSANDLSAMEVHVFKFATNHYINVMQRNSSKEKVPHMVKYLKAHIGHSVECATWLLQQFLNPLIIKECLMENTEKIMRSILVGLLHTAMVKIYDGEKLTLCDYWADVDNKVPQPRQTILGTLGLLLLQQLPHLKSFNKNHKQFLLLLARFTTLGSEARLFLNRANAMERMLNYFHNGCSPFYEAFLAEVPRQLILNELPDIGLPTPEGAISDKKGRLAKLKMQLRLKRFVDDAPKFSFLVEALANLARAKKNTQGKPTRYQLDQSDIELTEPDTVLFLPLPDFIDTILLEATKPRILHALCRAYMHYAVHDDSVAEKLFQTVAYGLTNQTKGTDTSHQETHEHHKVRPHFVLFQYLLEAKHESKWIDANFDAILNQFFRKLVFENRNYFQFMEYAIEFVWKLYSRVKAVRQWMSENQPVWNYLEEWVSRYKEPPADNNMLQSVQQTNLKLNKSRRGKMNAQRYNKTQNLMLHQWRVHVLGLMKAKTHIDLSGETDLDSLDLTDFKFTNGMKVDYMQDWLVPTQLIQGVILDDLSEILKVHVPSAENPDRFIWEPAYKNQIYPHGLISGLYRQQELVKIAAQIKQHQEQMEAQQRARMQQMRQQSSQQQYSGTGQDVRQHPDQNTQYQHVPDDDDSEDEEEDNDDDYVLGHNAAANSQAQDAQADFYTSNAGGTGNLSEENNVGGTGSVDNNYAAEDLDELDEDYHNEFSN